MIHPFHRERHLIERIGWLRAAVLGANAASFQRQALSSALLLLHHPQAMRLSLA